MGAIGPKRPRMPLIAMKTNEKQNRVFKEIRGFGYTDIIKDNTCI
jgi:hypothetical protein